MYAVDHLVVQGSLDYFALNSSTIECRWQTLMLVGLSESE